MHTVQLSQNEFEIVRSVIVNDISDLAASEGFFDDPKINAKDYIDARVSVANQFGLNFWKVVALNNSDYELRRLLAIYEGKTRREFLESYDHPSQTELFKSFLKALIDGQNNDAK